MKNSFLRTIVILIVLFPSMTNELTAQTYREGQGEAQVLGGSVSPLDLVMQKQRDNTYNNVVSSKNDRFFEDWEVHDVVKVYEKIELDYGIINEDGERVEVVYMPMKDKMKLGPYGIEVKKISQKLYRIDDSNYYILFKYNPYIYNSQEGVLELSNYSIKFYEKP